MKQLSILLIIFILCTSMTGCLQQGAPEDHAFVLAVGVDKGKQLKYFVTFMIQKGPKDPEGDAAAESTLVGAEGESLFDAMRIIRAALTNIINFTRTSIILFSSDAAREGLMKDFLSFTFDSVKIRRSTYLLVIQGEVRDFMQGMDTGEGISSELLQSGLSNRYGIGGYVPLTNAVSFFESTNAGRMDAIIPLGNIDESIISDERKKESEATGEEPKPKEEDTTVGIERIGGLKSTLMGSAIFDGWVMTGTLNGLDTQYLLIGRGEFHTGSLAIHAPDGNLIECLIHTSGSPKINLSLYPTPVAEVEIGIKCRVMHDSVELLESKWPEMGSDIEKYFEKQMSRIFEGCKSIHSDAFGFGKHAVLQFNSTDAWEEYNWKKQYENMEANFNVTIQFEDSFSSTHLE